MKFSQILFFIAVFCVVLNFAESRRRSSKARRAHADEKSCATFAKNAKGDKKHGCFIHTKNLSMTKCVMTKDKKECAAIQCSQDDKPHTWSNGKCVVHGRRRRH